MVIPIPDVRLNATEASEVAKMLNSSIAGWPRIPPAVAPPWNSSPAAHYGLREMRSDLEGFVFLLGGSDGEPLSGPLT